MDDMDNESRKNDLLLDADALVSLAEPEYQIPNNPKQYFKDVLQIYLPKVQGQNPSCCTVIRMNGVFKKLRINYLIL